MTPSFSRLPDWAMKLLLPITPSTRPEFHADAHGGDIEGVARFVARSPEGVRNNRLHWAACRAGEMAESGRVLASAVGLRLVKAAMYAGLTSREAARTVDSGFQKSGLRYEP